MRHGNIAARLGLRVDWAPSQRRGPSAYLCPTASPGPKEILILGGGFAGVYTARYLEKLLRADEASITLINRENYWVYQPMLPEVISGSIGPTNVVSPIRRLCPRTNPVSYTHLRAHET